MVHYLSLYYTIVWEHWPDTRGFITETWLVITPEYKTRVHCIHM